MCKDPNCKYCTPCLKCGHKADEHIAGESLLYQGMQVYLGILLVLVVNLIWWGLAYVSLVLWKEPFGWVVLVGAVVQGLMTLDAFCRKSTADVV